MNVLCRSGRIGAAFTLCVLTSCQHTNPPLYRPTTAKTHQEAANVYVANYPAVPWSEIADKLEPKHALTTEAARGIAAVTTQAQVSQFLSSFSAGLGIGLPTRTFSQTSATDANGVETTTSTRSRGTGPIPSSSGATSTAIGEGALAPDLSKGPAALGLDANTLLTAGTGVYQLAAILDNQISKAFYPAGYNAHLLTFQVSLQPKTRTRAYDVYVDLSVHPASWTAAIRTSDGVSSGHGASPPVIVYPLIISDALETTSTARSIEIMRQAALSLSGIVGTVGLSTGASKGTDALDAAIGQIRNSIVTVGRVSDHALRIRIGAQNSGEAGYAMVPRTYNISVVVLTRWPEDSTEKTQRVENLSVFADSEVVSVDGGAPLKSSRNRSELATDVAKAVQGLGFTIRKACADPHDKNPLPALDLLRAVDRQDYKQVNVCLTTDETENGNPLPDLEKLVGTRIRLEYLLSKLMQIQTSAANSKMFVPLKAWIASALPPKDQLVAMASDDTALVATVRGGTALKAEQLSAFLKLDNNAPIVARSIAVRDQSEVIATFPPLGEFDLKADGISKRTLKLSLKAETPEKSKNEDYDVFKIKAKEKEEKAANPISVAQTVLVPDDNGVARLSVVVGEVKDHKGNVRLQVGGADVREDSAPKPGTDGIVEASQKSVTRLAGC
jgi:hypothetical protein